MKYNSQSHHTLQYNTIYCHALTCTHCFTGTVSLMHWHILLKYSETWILNSLNIQSPCCMHFYPSHQNFQRNVKFSSNIHPCFLSDSSIINSNWAYCPGTVIQEKAKKLQLTLINMWMNWIGPQIYCDTINSITVSLCVFNFNSYTTLISLPSSVLHSF